MEALEARCSNLEQQLTQVLNHLGSTTGDLFASHSQVSKLEAIVKQQQHTIDNLEATHTFFQKQLPDYIDEQLQQAIHQRGSRGPDYINITKFISSHLAYALTTLQNHCTTILKETPTKQQNKQEPHTETPIDNSTLISLQLRIKQLEDKEPQIQQTSHQDNATITELKEHIHHLETNLLEEVQRAYRTVYKPGDYGAPLSKLQTMVELLNKEFQGFRGLDIKKLTESTIESTYEAIKKEIEYKSKLRENELQRHYREFEETLGSQITTFDDIKNKIETKVSELQEIYKKFEKCLQSQEITTKEIETRYKNIVYSIQTRKQEFETTVNTIQTMQDSIRTSVEQIEDTYTSVKTQLELQKKTKYLTERIYASFTTLETAIPIKVKELDTFLQDSIQTKFKEMNKLLDSYLRTQTAKITEFEDIYGTKTVQIFDAIVRDKINIVNKRIDVLVNKHKLLKSYTPADIYKSMTKCFYTAIIGKVGQSVDTLGPFERIDGWDYVCFTNQPIKNPYGWTIVQVDYTGTEPALEAKKYKWLSHTYLEDYDVVVWMDAYIAPNHSRHELLQTWILTMKEKDVQILHKTHPERKCVWDECAAVVNNKRDTEHRVSSVRSFLQSIRMPKEWGLFDTCIVIKMNKNIELQLCCESIYEQLCKTSVRDQLALTPIYYKNGYTKYYSNHLMNAFEIVGNHVRISV